MEKVDILEPPTFRKSGIVKTLEEAWNDEDWIGTFNLWILQEKPVPSIIYQQRSPLSNWAPNLLDVTAGGHLQSGEDVIGGLREVKEELGKTYKEGDLFYIGRKLHVSPDTKGRVRHNVVSIYFVVDDSPFTSYQLQEQEVYAICCCPITELLKVHTQKDYHFLSKGIDNKKNSVEIDVNTDSFPYNWDSYHFKIALLARRYFAGDKNLLY